MATKSLTYYSLDELVAAARVGLGFSSLPTRVGDDSPERSRFCGGTTGEAIRLAREGWAEQLDSTLELAESAIRLAEKEHLIDTFNPIWEVSGAEVDVARYLSGEPECMIDFPLNKTSKSGRIITLCASVCTSMAIRADSIQRRGKCVVALALALSRLGHNTELWADYSAGNSKHMRRVRVLVKSADDEIDPSRIMYAYAHPTMQRRLCFAASGNFNESIYMGNLESRPSAQDLPDGTIYLPEIRSDRDMPNADEFLKQYLGELGLLAE